MYFGELQMSISPPICQISFEALKCLKLWMNFIPLSPLALTD